MDANPVLLNTTNTQEVQNLCIVHEVFIKYEFTSSKTKCRKNRKKENCTGPLDRIVLRSSLFSKLVRLAEIIRCPFLKRKNSELGFRQDY